MTEADLRQLFKCRFDCWTALAGDEHDPDIMAMTENRFVEVVRELFPGFLADEERGAGYAGPGPWAQ